MINSTHLPYIVVVIDDNYDLSLENIKSEISDENKWSKRHSVRGIVQLYVNLHVRERKVEKKIKTKK